MKNLKKILNENIEPFYSDDFLDIQEKFLESKPYSLKIKDLYKGKAMSFNMRECIDFATKYYKVKE